MMMSVGSVCVTGGHLLDWHCSAQQPVTTSSSHATLSSIPARHGRSQQQPANMILEHFDSSYLLALQCSVQISSLSMMLIFKPQETWFHVPARSWSYLGSWNIPEDAGVTPVLVEQDSVVETSGSYYWHSTPARSQCCSVILTSTER